MSSNVGLTTPRGSGTSGYVQRNWAFMKPRNAGYGAPYPPVSAANAEARSFRQRQPDQQILEHDRRRAVEVKVMEERERLEEENERIEEEGGKGTVLTEEEIDERCEELRGRLLREMEEEEGERREKGGSKGKEMGRGEKKRQFKTYQVHELAEAKIEESERLRRALGIREDRETGEISSGRGNGEGRRRDRERENGRESEREKEKERKRY